MPVSVLQAWCLLLLLSFFFCILRASGRNFFIFFLSFFCFFSPSYGESYEDNFPSLPFEDSLPQSLLSPDDLIPTPLPSSSPETGSTSLAIEESDTAIFSDPRSFAQRKEAEINRLLIDLKHCANAHHAKMISQQIQRLWLQSGSETIDLLMEWVSDSINAGNYGLTLDYLDTIIALSPTYAEAWVRRAWVHIQLSDFKLAMFDLSQALQLEPRNYIAYFELGIIMESTQRFSLAIKAYETALHYYPQMRSLQKRIGFLLDQYLDQEV
ncbi:tetratricopeptide repeat protein [Bartonella sp. F02]|uniref:tetratricopeptide repeat protein n=1 Tax=Bartonella sp. F02 TaxID=2967262 RepID=UPI0022A99364|nr:hypothetical protein [Bartonella sp. F02]MCZ2328863.1 hypothetical protein [Bartonella sp. F02]